MPAQWDEEHLRSLAIDGHAAGATEVARSKYNPTPGMAFY